MEMVHFMPLQTVSAKTCLGCPSRSFVRTDIVTTIFREHIEQFW